jgi:ActR/RegA family two-component response regulator
VPAGVRILIVDDDAVFRQELGDLFEQDGHTVALAPSVPKAIEVLEAGEFDLVFTDLKMPRHSGLDLLREVRQRWPRVLVVVVTGFASVDTAIDAMKIGAFDYLRKPFQIARVQEVIALAREEVAFQGRGPPTRVAGLIERWRADGLPVLYVGAESIPARAGLTSVPLPSEAGAVRDVLEGFLPAHPTAAVVVDGLDQLFPEAGRSSFIPFVRSLRERIGDRGPLVVTFDPTRWSAAEVEELTAALAAGFTRSTMEALSNPIRRSVLQRAGAGPISFTQALEAAGLDDSPKLAFHLRRLVEEGLLGHVDETYRISARGEELLRLLAHWDQLASSGPRASAAVPRPSHRPSSAREK